MNTKSSFTVRHAKFSDLDELSKLENRCFPPSEACSREHMQQRLQAYPDWFFLHEENEKIVSFVDGLISDKSDLTDEMYEKTALHHSNGKWLMILGVNTDPEYRHNGLASKCIISALKQAEQNGLYGAVLTCKERLIPFYESLGFCNEGISQSTHGNVIWYQMRKVIPAIDKFQGSCTA